MSATKAASTLVQSLFPLPVGIAKLGTRGTVFRKDDSSRLNNPCLARRTRCSAFGFINRSFKKKEKGVVEVTGGLWLVSSCLSDG